MDEFEQNIVTCQWRADQLFAEEKSQYFGVNEFSIIVLSFDHQVCFFNEHLWEAKRSAIFRARAIARRRKEWFRLRMNRILFAKKAQLDDI